jgi:hypothetical protein
VYLDATTLIDPGALSFAPVCRNLETLHHFEPPATPDEVRASALQYVRKLTGMHTPSRANRAAFDAAVETITRTTLHLFDHLDVQTPPRAADDQLLMRFMSGS